MGGIAILGLLIRMEAVMANEQNQKQEPQDQKQQRESNSAKERLKKLGFIDMTKPGAGIAFIGGVRKRPKREPGKTEVPDNEQE